MSLFGVGISDLGAAAGKVAQSLTSVGVHRSGQLASGISAAQAGNAATGATITSNDFLRLLVTEMKNQDPTQPTDPNAYIQQLVGVNSLQQLIAINKDLAVAPTLTGTATK